MRVNERIYSRTCKEEEEEKTSKKNGVGASCMEEKVCAERE